MGKGKDGKAAKDERKEKVRPAVPRFLAPTEDAPTLKTRWGEFDLEDPVLPAWVEERALAAGGYPYDETIKSKHYEEALTPLQVELVKLQHHVAAAKERLVIVFEGRDAAGKGGSIFVICQYLNPRAVHAVALPKPTETERGQWYFQRYAEHLPTAGEIVLFDRSWYNRAGVETVMGFCTSEQHKAFLVQTPGFEKMLTHDGIRLFKFWLDMGRETQLKRFHERRHNPLKIWKLSPIDFAALGKWDDYTKARDTMFAATDTREAPWTVVLANDQKRARLEIVRHILATSDYPGKDKGAIGKPDPRILGRAKDLLGKD
jgi:polyphosphate kinase 2